MVYEVGEKRLNPRILSAVNSTNADGSSRRMITAAYDLVFADGSVHWDTKRQFIVGSSFGSCATPQTGAEMRWMGDGKAVSFHTEQRVTNAATFNISDGSVINRTLSRTIDFLIVDPQRIATYAIVTGAGPSSTVVTLAGFPTVPWSLKFVSPRVIRSDPLFAGKANSYANLGDFSPFYWCPGPSHNNFGAEFSDCARYGAAGGTGVTVSATQGLSYTVDAATQDRTMANWNFHGTYTVKLYNDDGWKTVNGHAGKTPVAIVTDTMPEAPATFAQMANWIYPIGNMPTLAPDTTPSAFAAALRAGTLPATTVTVGKPTPTDGDTSSPATSCR